LGLDHHLLMMLSTGYQVDPRPECKETMSWRQLQIRIACQWLFSVAFVIGLAQMSNSFQLIHDPSTQITQRNAYSIHSLRSLDLLEPFSISAESVVQTDGLLFDSSNPRVLLVELLPHCHRKSLQRLQPTRHLI